MSGINKDNINHLITNNLYKLYEFIGKEKGCKLHTGRIVDWVITKPSCWPNMIYNTRTSGQNAYVDIDEIVKYIREKEAPPFWIITPETDRSVEAIFETSGMLTIDQLPGMAVDLNEFINNFNLSNLNNELRFAEVSSVPELLQWLAIVNKVIFKGKNLNPDLFSSFIGNPYIHFYTGFIKDIPVATAMSFINYPSAGFYNIATIPDFRKRGHGSAMTAFSMVKAYNQGCKTGILHASAMGEPVYAKLGFRPYGEYRVFWMAGKEYRDY